MAKRGVKIPLTIKGKDYLLNKKEYALYRVLADANGNLVLINELKRELECDEGYLRFIKNSLLRTVENNLDIVNDYGTGYRLVSE